MPAQQPKTDLGGLDKRITDLQRNLATLVGQSSNVETSELFKIIHHPGWTTPQQVELASQILESMNQQAAALQGMRNTLQAHVNQSAAQG